jgi:hypothetical protein
MEAGTEAVNMKFEHVLREQGVPATHQLVRERNLAERRLAALITAVRDHERVARRLHGIPGQHDLRLYSRLRQIAGENGTR